MKEKLTKPGQIRSDWLYRAIDGERIRPFDSLISSFLPLFPFLVPLSFTTRVFMAAVTDMPAGRVGQGRSVMPAKARAVVRYGGHGVDKAMGHIANDKFQDLDTGESEEK